MTCRKGSRVANSRTRATSLPDERRSLDGTSTGALPLLFRHCHTIARLALRARRAITWASLRSSNYHAGATTLLLDHYPALFEIDGATQVWHSSARYAQFRAPAFPSSA